ncbi:FG-GAP repeat protein [Geminisphaera colitermitum]|uniref:FG-GAP repeat protein n=1 Tax=Geminisphaera colitermitum TaxID=1148786 RepID=UPI000158C8BA|nr:FG-GAP repeat protein [Geminisphaera colitermitum]
MKIKSNDNSGTLRRAFLTLGAPGALGLALLALAAPHARASNLTASDGAQSDNFGISVSASGDSALAGASLADGNVGYSGAAYYFRGLGNETGPTVTEFVKLLASDAAAQDRFGYSVSLSGDSALTGANSHDANGEGSGAAYYYKGLNNAVGPTVTEDVKLLASDGAVSDTFGESVSLSGTRALVGAWGDDDKGLQSGSAYYFKGLDGKATGSTVTEDVKLLASDGAGNDYFGKSVSLSGDRALAGAYWDDDMGGNSGSAYYFKGLDSKTGRPEGYTGPASVTTATYENVKLLASDGAASDLFGRSVSLSGDSALAGAQNGDGNVANTGAAYYYKGLDSKTGRPEGYTGPASITTATYENVKLIASDGAASHYFGGDSVSLSGECALVGATRGDGKEATTGAAYYYVQLSGKSGTVTEAVKLFASDGAKNDAFGYSVGLSDNRFVVGAYNADPNGVLNAGKAYAGDIRAFTTLDNYYGTPLATDGLSFESQDDWIIGVNTAGNKVTLSAGDTATVSTVYIGQDSGYNNTLVVQGTLNAGNVQVGNPHGAVNKLQIDSTGTIGSTGTIALYRGNIIAVEGDYTADVSSLLTRIGAMIIAYDALDVFQPVNIESYPYLITISYEDGYTVINTNNIVPGTVTPATLGEPVISGSTITINALGTAGNYYALYASQNLLGNAASWGFVAGTASQFDESGTATITFTKSAATAEFYRLVTSATALDGVTINDDAKYSTNVDGRYDVTIPANGAALVSHLLESSAGNLVTSLFANVRANTRINVQQPDGSFASVSKGVVGWAGTTTLELPLGQAAYVVNGGAATTLTFAGLVQTGNRSYSLQNNVKTLLASSLPIAVADPVDIGYTRATNELFNWYNTSGAAVSGTVPFIGSGWTGTQPSFAIGQGFYLTPRSNKTWVQPGVAVSTDNLEITQ